MSKIVKTVPGGTIHWGPYSDKEPYTDEQAEAVARKANAQAEELGLETRYEVVEVEDA